MSRQLSRQNLPTREDEISFLVIGAALNISAKLGAGLSEAACETILFHDLAKACSLNARNTFRSTTTESGLKMRFVSILSWKTGS